MEIDPDLLDTVVFDTGVVIVLQPVHHNFYYYHHHLHHCHYLSRAPLTVVVRLAMSRLGTRNCESSSRSTMSLLVGKWELRKKYSTCKQGDEES